LLASPRRSSALSEQCSLDSFFPAGSRRYWKALYLDGFPDAAIATTVDWSNRRPSTETLVIVRHCGGAIARVEAEQTAFGDRSSEWMLSVDSTWHDPAEDGTNVSYTRAFWDAAAPFSDGKTYFNFPGLLEEGDAAVRANYGANHARVARIKVAWRVARPTWSAVCRSAPGSEPVSRGGAPGSRGVVPIRSAKARREERFSCTYALSGSRT
jgi:hypothetical protein